MIKILGAFIFIWINVFTGVSFSSAGICRLKEKKKLILLSEQSQHRLAIADVEGKKIIWEWKAENSSVKPEHLKWFTNPSDAKLVYDEKYILMSASGGGVALIRISDKKAVFYAYAGGNPHSAELLPGGNIVSASSTGNFLTLFKMDSNATGDHALKKQIPIAFGHNVVWDSRNKLLWTAAMNHLKSFRYNYDCDEPGLTLVDSIAIPGTEAHDLFPDYGTNILWLTTPTNVYQFDVASKKISQAAVMQDNIKSVSSGPESFPVIVIHPKEKWWTDEVLDGNGQTVYKEAGLKIYKARWMLTNGFSYPKNDRYKQCK